MKRRHLLAALPATVMLAGCSYTDIGQSVISGTWPSQRSDLAARAYRAVDDMLAGAPTLQDRGGPVVVATIGDIGNLDHSTPFGNIVSDMIRTRLVQRGVAVTELRLRSSVRLGRSDGELMLGRNPHTLLPPPLAAEVVTGTYAVGSSDIYVSLKIVAAGDAYILAAADFEMPRTWNVDQLLGTSTASLR